jgi:hypothetical protein
MSSTTHDQQQQQTGPFICEVEGCGREFTRIQGLGRHQAETHGLPTSRASQSKKPTQPKAQSLQSEIANEVHELLAPMHTRLAAVNAEIETQQRKLTELKDARASLESVLRKVDPASMIKQSGRIAAAKNSHDAKNQRKLDNARSFLDEHREDFADGIIATRVITSMREAGIEPIASPEKMRRILETLRDEGLIRADRVVKGGGMQFVYVAGRNGSHV